MLLVSPRFVSNDSSAVAVRFSADSSRVVWHQGLESSMSELYVKTFVFPPLANAQDTLSCNLECSTSENFNSYTKEQKNYACDRCAKAWRCVDICSRVHSWQLLESLRPANHSTTSLQHDVQLSMSPVNGLLFSAIFSSLSRKVHIVKWLHTNSDWNSQCQP